jgi:hypothetical protein
MLPNQQASPASAPSNFASLLARFAAQPSGSANADGLADDVVSLSYEQALKAHARYRPSASLDSLRADEFAATNSDLPASPVPNEVIPLAAPSTPGTHESRKSASITIRMSPAESEQLHARAAAADLTISAYLRSCIFEVESLRAQVKDALAQLRSTAEPASAERKPPESAPMPSGRWRFFSRWHTLARSAHA